MKFLLVVFAFVLSMASFAESELPEGLVTREIIRDMRPVPKINRDMMRVCVEHGYEKICIDGTTRKEICKIFVNGSVIMASDSRGKLLQIIASSAGLLASDLLCDTYNRPICAEILVCKRWEM